MKCFLASPQATERLGTVIAQTIKGRAVIALSGQLGAGKTTLVKAIAKGLEIEEVVNSPTFVLMTEYQGGRLPLYHLDLYRFSNDIKAGGGAVIYDLEYLADELEELYAEGALVVIEWPEYFVLGPQTAQRNFLDEHDHIKINLSYAKDSDDARVAEIEAHGPHSGDVVKNVFNLTKNMFSYL